MKPALVAVAVIASLPTVPALAQQVLETDPEAGRMVIDGPFRAISTPPYKVGIAEDARILYLLDLEEPEGVMAFSLETGELVRTVPIKRGDGPAELRWITSITPASDGGMYVSGFERVLEFDSGGRLESDWSVRDITGRNVCEMDGQPAVISETGNLVRRGRNGDGEVVGDWSVDVPEDASATAVPALMTGHYRTVLACSGGTAYVMTVPESGSVGPFSVLRQAGPAGRLPLPAEFLDAWDWQQGFLPTVDGQGNIVVISDDNEIWGAVISPETGCYAVLRNSGRARFGEFRGIYADSALVLHRDYEEFRDGRRTVVRVHDVAARVSLVPFRRVSGDPCPGMFPSLDEASGPDTGAPLTATGTR